MAIQIKNLEQLKLMRKAGLVVAHTLNLIRDSAEIGMTTVDLDSLAVRSLEKYNAKSSFKGYHGFPAVICASVNEEVVHGIPNKRVIQDGDILSVDFERYIKSQGSYGILREYGGHGIGSEMHQEPHVLNFGKGGNGPDLIPGMALAIEPMITRGSEKMKVLSDEWTVVSQDHSRGAHFEHTYAIAPDGKPFVLTAIDGGKAELSRLGIEISELLLP